MIETYVDPKRHATIDTYLIHSRLSQIHPYYMMSYSYQNHDHALMLDGLSSRSSLRPLPVGVPVGELFRHVW